MLFSIFLKQVQCSLNGIEFSDDGKTLLLAPPDLKEIIIPKKCEVINGGETRIQSSFILCLDGIKHISFEENSQLIKIFPYVFSNSSLETADLHACTKLENLNYGVFSYCDKLQTVILPEGLKMIQAGCFYHSKGLKSIKIPDTVEIIEGWQPVYCAAFDGCTNLREVIITENSNLKEIGVDTFFGAIFTDFYIPKNASVIAKGIYGTKVTTIRIHPENKHFSFDGTSLMSYNNDTVLLLKYNEGLEYTVPSTVTKFGDSSCRFNNLTKIIFTNKITAFGTGVFASSKLKSIDLPRGFSYVPFFFIAQSFDLVSVTLTTDITIIGERAFEDCTSLIEIKNYDSLIELYNRAFYNCSSLLEFNCPQGLNEYSHGVFHGCNKLVFNINGNSLFSYDNNNILYFRNTEAKEYFGKGGSIVIPETCTLIGDSIFYTHPITSITISSTSPLTIQQKSFCCTQIETITLPSSTKELGDSAFSDISTLTTVNMEATSIITIPNECFSRCPKLSSITFPNCLKEIGSLAFYLCKLPETLDLKATKLETIGNQAFMSTGVHNAIFPATLTTVGENMFCNSSLVCVDMSLCQINTIQEGAFLDCASLREVIFCKSVSDIRSFSFSNCISLEEIIFPHDIEYIKSKAFFNCINLKSFNLTLNCLLKSIGSQAFKDCSSLKDIFVPDDDLKFFAIDGVLMNKNQTTLILFLPSSPTLIFVVPSTVTNIGNYAFQDCANLRTVAIPEGTKIIGYHSFEGCLRLSSLYIPRSLEGFGENSFFNCPGLKCGSVAYPHGKISMAINAGIPEIAFETICPSLNYPSCKQVNILRGFNSAFLILLFYSL